jgi:hypothetical protein
MQHSGCRRTSHAPCAPFSSAQGAHFKEQQVGSQENKTAAYGIFSMDARLDEVVTSLNAAGFESVNICVFLPPAHPIADVVRNMKSASADFSAEAGFERTVSWLSAFGGVVIPGVGFFVGSREYPHALAQSDCWLESVGNGALLASLGIPEEAAARYEARVRRDATLIFVSCDGSAQSEWAREILRRLHAEEVRSLGEFERTKGEADKAGLRVSTG